LRLCVGFVLRALCPLRLCGGMRFTPLVNGPARSGLQMTESLSFDGMGGLYDETRTCDPKCLAAALDFLAARFPPDAFRKVVEPGIGTGRIAIPLAERGYEVTGVDISDEMMAVLGKRLAHRTPPLRVRFQKADATNLPFPDATFDMAIAVHLFYFIRDWREAAGEMLRVVRRDGPVILMHTGTGAEVPLLNQRYKELCAELGCPINEIGVKSTREVVDYLESLGCRTEWIRDRWKWTASLRLGKALGYMKARAYSFTALASDDVHRTVMAKLESEIAQRFGALAAQVEVPNEVYLVLARKHP